jgi:transposase
MQETGSPASLPMSGKRPFALAKVADWVLGRLKEKPDLTLHALLAELRERGVEVSYYAVWHFVARSGLSFKKNATRQRARSRRCGPAASALAEAPGQA